MEVVAIIAIPTLLALMVWLSLVRVPEGEVVLLKRRGGGSRKLEAGLHFRLPILDRVERRINLLGHSLDLDVPDLRGSDGMTCSARGRVYFQVVDARDGEIALAHPEEAVVDAALRTLRALPEAGVDAECDASAPDTFNQSLKRALNDRLRQKGLMVVRCQLELSRAA